MGFSGIAESLEFGGFLRRMIGTPYLVGIISLLLKMLRWREEIACDGRTMSFLLELGRGLIIFF